MSFRSYTGKKGIILATLPPWSSGGAKIALENPFTSARHYTNLPLKKNGWVKPDELTDQINLLRTNEKVRGFAFYSASNLSRLSLGQAKTLFDKQLSSTASIDDDRHVPAVTKPVVNNHFADSVQFAENEKHIQQDFLSSFDYNPVSIRETWKSLSGIAPSVKRIKGNRLLSWKTQKNGAKQYIALVAFKKTGEKKYLQTVLEFSKSGDFTISDQRWKELKKMELLLVTRNIQDKTDQYSNFFPVKKKKNKNVGEPF